MLVQHFLEDSADRTPDKIALVCDGRRLSYAQIEAAANRLGHALTAHGLERGDRVALFLPNCVELVVGIFGILKAGGVFVVVNSMTKYGKLAYILNNCQTTALITSGRNAGMMARLAQDVASLRTIVVTSPAPAKAPVQGCVTYDAIQEGYPPDRLPHKNIDLDLACLVYTSGTTGEPKGVMSDHGNVAFAAGSIIEYLENVEDDVVINVLPLSFDYGLYQLLMSFKFGGTLVLEKGFMFPSAVLQHMQEERVTGFPGVPTMYAMLLDMNSRSYDLSSLRYMTNTAAVLSPTHISRLREKFPRVRLYSMYGLTETKRTLYLPPDQLDKRPGSVGIAIPGTEVWIEDDHGCRLGPGEIGELVVRGRHVMRGYWSDSRATRERYRPGPIPGERLCYTGDFFTMDEDGYFYFVARKDDIIKSRGEKVAPKEVENVLYSLEGVKEAAVIGVADDIQGQAIKAFVVADGTGLNEARVLAHCRANLEDFMVPKYVVLCSELPKTGSGKVRKVALK